MGWRRWAGIAGFLYAHGRVRIWVLGRFKIHAARPLLVMMGEALESGKWTFEEGTREAAGVSLRREALQRPRAFETRDPLYYRRHHQPCLSQCLFFLTSPQVPTAWVKTCQLTRRALRCQEQRVVVELPVERPSCSCSRPTAGQPHVGNTVG